MGIFTFLRVPWLLKTGLAVISLILYFLIIVGFVGSTEVSLSTGANERLPEIFFSVR